MLGLFVLVKNEQSCLEKNFKEHDYKALIIEEDLGKVSEDLTKANFIKEL